LAGFALLAGAPQPAAAASFAGNWYVRGQLYYGRFFGQVNPVCTFRQSGSAISGECRGPNAVGPVSGSVNGNRILWQWRTTATTPIGTTGVITFHGTAAGNEIQGTWTTSAAPGGVGTFKQTRS
jgi:hypothetical protein